MTILFHAIELKKKQKENRKRNIFPLSIVVISKIKKIMIIQKFLIFLNPNKNFPQENDFNRTPLASLDRLSFKRFLVIIKSSKNLLNSQEMGKTSSPEIRYSGEMVKDFTIGSFEDPSAHAYLHRIAYRHGP